MNYFGKNIRALRKIKGLSQQKLADELNVSKSTIWNWENGTSTPTLEKLSDIAFFFGVYSGTLFSENVSLEVIEDMSVPTSKVVPMTQKAPLYGTIAAGVPREMWTLESELPVPSELISKYPDSFFLRVEGNSMNKLIPDGAYALIVPTENVQNGDTVAVNINGYDATLKQWYKTNNSLILSPCSYDSEFEDLVYRDGDESNPTVRVLGVMVWFMGDFK